MRRSKKHSVLVAVLVIFVVVVVVVVVVVALVVAHWLLIRALEIVVLEATLGASIFITAVVDPPITILWNHVVIAVLTMVVLVLIVVLVLVPVFIIIVFLFSWIITERLFVGRAVDVIVPATLGATVRITRKIEH